MHNSVQNCGGVPVLFFLLACQPDAMLASHIEHWPSGDGWWTLEGDGGYIDITGNEADYDRYEISMLGDDLSISFELSRRADTIYLLWDGAQPGYYTGSMIATSADEVGTTNLDDITTTLEAVEACPDGSGDGCLLVSMDAGPLAGSLWLHPDLWLTAWQPDGGSLWTLLESGPH